MLDRLGEDAKPLAGGQTLIPMLKMRMGDVTDLIDIGRLPNLADIELDENYARIGALATHARILPMPTLTFRLAVFSSFITIL